MMEISSKVRYALLVLVLATYHEQREFWQIEQIANFQQIPDRYLGCETPKLPVSSFDAYLGSCG